MSAHAAPVLDPAAAASLDAARAAGEAAAQRAGVRVTMPTEPGDLDEAAEVWQRVWSPEGEPPVSGEMLRALTHAGNYLSAAMSGDRVVGALMGFYGGNGRVDLLHSHILGVVPDTTGRGVGYALKLHQRAWALERGLRRITWTYDPLVRRNGHFNLCKLGARGEEYLVDFYGAMPDAINNGDHTDRILVAWDLDAAQPHGQPLDVDSLRARGAVMALDVDADERPLPRRDRGDADLLLCATPADIVAMRRTDRHAAQAWRRALREVMLEAMSRGLRPVSMAPGGWYVLSRDAE